MDLVWTLVGSKIKRFQRRTRRIKEHGKSFAFPQTIPPLLRRASAKGKIHPRGYLSFLALINSSFKVPNDLLHLTSYTGEALTRLQGGLPRQTDFSEACLQLTVNKLFLQSKIPLPGTQTGKNELHYLWVWMGLNT